jgi:hypothetical protein
MAASANLQSVPAVRSEQGGSFFRRTTSCLSFNRVPFLEMGMGGSVPCSCVIELHGQPGTGKSFTLSEMAVEALVNCGSTASADQRTVLWFDTDLKFNPDCIMKCAKHATSAFGSTLTFEELLSRILVFKPSDVLQLVATLQGMRLGADLGSFADFGIPIMVIVDGVLPLFLSSRAAGDSTHSMFDQVPHFLIAADCFKRLPLYCVAQLIVELGAISGRGRGDMPKFQCCVLVSSVPMTGFSSSHPGNSNDQVFQHISRSFPPHCFWSSSAATGVLLFRTNSP